MVLEMLEKAIPCTTDDFDCTLGGDIPITVVLEGKETLVLIVLSAVKRSVVEVMFGNGIARVDNVFVCTLSMDALINAVGLVEELIFVER